jgi:hypothetical protein
MSSERGIGKFAVSNLVTVFQLKVADVEELVRAMQFLRVVVISRYKSLLFVRLG